MPIVGTFICTPVFLTSSLSFQWLGPPKGVSRFVGHVIIHCTYKMEKNTPRAVAKDPAVKAIYDFISEFWAIKRKGSQDSLAGATALGTEEVENDQDNSDVTDPYGDSLLDGSYDEALLASLLGVDVVAPVAPCPESQVPPDSMLPEVPCEVPDTIPEHPEPIQLFQSEQEQLEDAQGQPEDYDSQEVPPTVLETTPPSSALGEVVDVVESPILTIKNPFIPAKYSDEELANLRAKIEKVKPLSH